jgi:hypothetical protein
MKTLALATVAAAVLALSMPAYAHMRCGYQWPNDDVRANSDFPTFSSTDCMAEQLNAQELGGGMMPAPAPAPMAPRY